MKITEIILLIWAVLAFWVLGHVWMIQIVIYPLFAKVGDADFAEYHRFYSRRVIPTALIPGFASFLLPIPFMFFGSRVSFWMDATLVATGIFGLLVTVGLQIPRHLLLARKGKDPTTIVELIRYNWLRTLSVSVQAAVTFLMLCHVFASEVVR